MSKRYPGNFITGNPVALSQTSNAGVWDLKDNYQATNNGTWQEPDGIYEIGRSLRFRQSASAYFERTPTVSGNRKTWTYSTWVKFGAINNGNTFNFGLSPQYGGDGANECQMYLTAAGEIRVYDSGGSTGYFVVKTTSLFRDPSAWYHIVVVVDTTLAVAIDRVKIFANGIRQPVNIEVQVSQNQDTGWNHTYRHRIGVPGYTTNSSQAHDGHLAEINHIDGQSLDPSYFGYFDPITNIWQPKKYTGAYGTNGFYLPFSENQTTTNLGKNFAGSNLLTYSEQFDNAAWAKTNVTVSANATTSPDGTTNADKIISSVTNGDHAIFWSPGTLVLGTRYTFSVYAKAGEYSNLFLYPTSYNDYYIGFNLSTGVISNFDPTGETNMTAVGNGWYRCSWTFTCTNATSNGLSFYINTTSPYAGNASNGLFLWGAQFNLGRLDPYTQTVATAANTNWTPNNFSITAGVSYDSMVDSPTNIFTTATDVGGVVPGNYAILNPLEGAFGNITISNGGLTLTSGGNSGYHNCGATFSPEGNIGYFEVTCTNSPNGHIGVSSAVPNYLNYAASPTADTIYLGTDGTVYNIYTATIKSGSITAPSSGDVIMVAFDFTNPASKKLWFGRNGTWGLDASNNTGNPAAGTNATVTSSNLLSTSNYRWYFGLNNGAAFAFNFGQRAFSHTPPTGFKSLNTTSLQSRGTAAVGKAAIQTNKWVDVNLYGGNGAENRIVNSGEFSPDLVWTKTRNTSTNGFNIIRDSVRGPSLRLIANGTQTELDDSNYGVFNTNGFTSLNQANANAAGNSYVGWQWKQSPTAGFNIVSYTGNGANNRGISHNLGAVPGFIIVKNRDDTYNWDIYHKNLGVGATMIFTPSATRNYSAFGSTEPNSSNFFTQDQFTNTNNNKYIAYVWAEVPGFSKIGVWTGNGSADGTFVYTGFRPKLVIAKRYDAGNGNSWRILDSVRNPFNQVSNFLFPDDNAVEDPVGYPWDFVSNGFKIRTTNAGDNASGATYLYIAFAESPFALNNRAR